MNILNVKYISVLRVKEAEWYRIFADRTFEL